MIHCLCLAVKYKGAWLSEKNIHMNHLEQCFCSFYNGNIYTFVKHFYFAQQKRLYWMSWNFQHIGQLQDLNTNLYEPLSTLTAFKGRKRQYLFRSADEAVPIELKPTGQLTWTITRLYTKFHRNNSPRGSFTENPVILCLPVVTYIHWM